VSVLLTKQDSFFEGLKSKENYFCTKFSKWRIYGGQIFLSWKSKIYFEKQPAFIVFINPVW